MRSIKNKYIKNYISSIALILIVIFIYPHISTAQQDEMKIGNEKVDRYNALSADYIPTDLKEIAQEWNYHGSDYKKFVRAEVFEKGFSLDNPAYESMAKVISATSNVPLDRLYGKINNIKAALSDEAEAWQSLAMVLGWPEWQIMDDKKPKSKSSSKGGYKRKSGRPARRKSSRPAR